MMRSSFVLILSLCVVEPGFVPPRRRLAQHVKHVSTTEISVSELTGSSASTKSITHRKTQHGVYRNCQQRDGNGVAQRKGQLKHPHMYQAFRPQDDALNNLEERIQTLSEVRTNRYLTVILASWAKSGEKDAAERCRAVLNHLSLFPEDTPNLSPNKFAYGVTIDAFTRRSQAGRAEAVLRESIIQGEENASLMPSVVSFNSVINAWSKSRRPDAPDRCEALLREMSQLAQCSGNRDLTPDVVTYTTVINALAKRGRSQKAEALFREMWSAGDENVLPNDKTYGALMHAWTKSRAPDAIKKCKQLLTDMQEFADEYGKTELAPTVVTYSTMIDAFARRGEALEAEGLLRTMLMDGPLPNRVTFNSVINAWSKSNAEDAPMRCERLLSEMKSLAKETGRADLGPDVFTYTSLIDVFAKRGHAQAAEDVLRSMLVRDGDKLVPIPNAFTVAAVMNAWAKSDADDAPDRCRRLLSEIDEFAVAQAEVDGSELLRPNAFAYNAVVNAYAKRGRPHEAEELLREMLDVSNDKPFPDVVTFSSVMDGWANSDVDDGAERCRRLLNEMKELSKASTGRMRYKYQPSGITYTTVMTAYGKRGLAAEAESVFREMLADGKTRPTIPTYTAVMLAWLKSPTGTVDDAMERCEYWFGEMRRRVKQGKENLRPQKQTYSIMIRMYEKAGRDDKAEEIRQQLAHWQQYTPPTRKRNRWYC